MAAIEKGVEGLDIGLAELIMLEWQMNGPLHKPDLDRHLENVESQLYGTFNSWPMNLRAE